MNRDLRPETLDLRPDINVPPLCKGRRGGVDQGLPPLAPPPRQCSGHAYKGGGRLLCFFASLLLCFFSLKCANAFASEVDDARNLIQSGQLETGAQTLVRFVKANPNDSTKTPEALLLLGKALDRLADVFSERVEMACYWGKSGESLACPRGEVEKLNSIYGAGAFRFITDIAYVPYTGIHYREVVERFPKSSQAPEAEFWLLLKNLVGSPETVLSRVKAFLDKHGDGEIGRKALLLWARVNEDIWNIYRQGGLAAFGTGDLQSKAESYRQESIRAYEKLIGKYSGTFEATAAKRESGLLKAGQDDGETFSILQESTGGSPDKWGSTIPKPQLKATPRGVGESGWKSDAPASAPLPAGESKEKSRKGTSKRWE